MEIKNVNLEELMKKNNITTIQELSQRTGISRNTLTKYKSADGIKSITFENLMNLCSMLNCSVDELIITTGSSLLLKRNREKVNNFYTSNYNLPFKFKLNEMVDTLDTMIKFTKRELLNFFTVEEATLIIACTNCLLYNPDFSPKSCLMGSVEGSIMLGGYDTLYNVDKNSLMEKLDKLSEFQSYTVLNMAFEYWDNARENPIDENNETLKRIFLIRQEE